MPEVIPYAPYLLIDEETLDMMDQRMAGAYEQGYRLKSFHITPGDDMYIAVMEYQGNLPEGTDPQSLMGRLEWVETQAYQLRQQIEKLQRR